MIQATKLCCHGNRRVWVDRWGGLVRVRLSEARKRPDELVLQCALCERVAYVIDHLAPYFQTDNRCRLHTRQTPEEGER